MIKIINKQLEKFKTLVFGLILVIFLTISAISLQNVSFIKILHLSPIILAILLGILVKNTIGIKPEMDKGIKFCAKKILRFAIILLGFKLSIPQVAELGIEGIVIIGIIVTLTMLFTYWAGQKLCLSKNLSLLIASGCSICGAAAIIAVSALSEQDDGEDVSFAIGVITIFGTIFMLLYPIFYKLFSIDISTYSFWAGSSIHEVAQVVAAGFAVSNDAGIMATLVKLTRVLYLIPITLVLSYVLNKKESYKFNIKDIQIPWFVICFALVIIINSTFSIPTNIINILNQSCVYLMTAAMVGLGLETNFSQMKKVGLKPLYLGIIASIFVSITSIVIIKAFGI